MARAFGGRGWRVQRAVVTHTRPRVMLLDQDGQRVGRDCMCAGLDAAFVRCRAQQPGRSGGDAVLLAVGSDQPAAGGGQGAVVGPGGDPVSATGAVAVGQADTVGVDGTAGDAVGASAPRGSTSDRR